MNRLSIRTARSRMKLTLAATALSAAALLAASLAANSPVAAAEEASAAQRVGQARDAALEGRLEEAVELCAQALKADADYRPAYELRARLYDALKRHEAAASDYSELIRRDPRNADLYDARGSSRFKNNEIEASIADFDKAIERDPARERGHWKRGISYYYAGEFEKGRKQFEAYQTFDDNDVENAAWRYLCMARESSPREAAADILKIKDDRRVPMMQVYELYRGAATPESVLEKSKAGEPNPAELNNRLFYAHLYIGLYYDAAGDRQQALDHVRQAEKHRIGHYMWDVARVHRLRLEAAQAPR